jgi:hypothetical protein
VIKGFNQRSQGAKSGLYGGCPDGHCCNVSCTAVGRVVIQCVNTIPQKDHKAAFSEWIVRLKSVKMRMENPLRDFHNNFLDHVMQLL